MQKPNDAPKRLNADAPNVVRFFKEKVAILANISYICRQKRARLGGVKN